MGNARRVPGPSVLLSLGAQPRPRAPVQAADEPWKVLAHARRPCMIRSLCDQMHRVWGWRGGGGQRSRTLVGGPLLGSAGL